MKKRFCLQERNKGRLLIISTALLWGLAGVCVKSIPWNPVSIMAARCAIGVLMLGIHKKSFAVHFNKKTVFGSVMMSLTGILYMMSIKLTTAATAIVLQYVAPIFVFLYSVIFQKNRPKAAETLIVLAVFGGCVLSFSDQLDASHLLGNTLGLLSGVAFAGQIIVFSDPATDSDEGMYLSNLISFIVCAPFLFFDKRLIFTPKVLFWVLILGVFQYGLANICYAKGCHKIGKIETSVLLTLEPIFNPIPVWIITGEKMGPRATLGFIVVLLSVTLYGLLPQIERRKEAFNKQRISIL